LVKQTNLAKNENFDQADRPVEEFRLFSISVPGNVGAEKLTGNQQTSHTQSLRTITAGDPMILRIKI